MPSLGIGTWKAPPGEVGRAIEAALDVGYIHIDCASLYQNEKEVGEVLGKAIKSGKVKRENLFIVSKLWSTDWGRVSEAVEQTLKDLQLDYLDLYLVHAPASFEYSGGNMWPTHPNGQPKLGKVPFHTVWPEMEKLVDRGLVRSIGISNFSFLLVNDLLTYARIKPVMNQIEVHPYLPQQELIDYCLSQNVQITAYCPLANGVQGPLQDPWVVELAGKYKVTPAQLLIRWSIDKGYSVIPKSTKPERVLENFNIFNFKISPEDLKRMEGLKSHNLRACDLGKFWSLPFYQ